MNAIVSKTSGVVEGSIVNKINAAHKLAQAAAQTAVGHAIDCGRLLIEAKQAVQHGEWSTWLEQHFEGSTRTARTYMMVATRHDTLDEAKRQRVANLSFRQAVRELSEPRPVLGAERKASPQNEDSIRTSEKIAKCLPWETSDADLIPASDHCLVFGADLDATHGETLIVHPSEHDEYFYVTMLRHHSNGCLTDGGRRPVLKDYIGLSIELLGAKHLLAAKPAQQFLSNRLNYNHFLFDSHEEYMDFACGRQARG